MLVDVVLIRLKYFHFETNFFLSSRRDRELITGCD